MTNQEITVHVIMDEKIYKRFSFFDSFRLRKRGRSPLLFSAIMIGFAVICLLIKKQESVMIGSVLAVIGLGLPFVWVGSFVSSVNLQALKLNLNKPRPVYSVYVGSLLRIENDMKKEPPQEVSWDKVFGVWRGKNASYLYVTPSKAFILPDGQADAAPSEVWKALSDRIGGQKMHGKIK